MFKVISNVYHSYQGIEHTVKFYTDRSAAFRYMESLGALLDDMQNDGTVVSYDIQLLRGCKEVDKC